jgi:hypothetical protein
MNTLSALTDKMMKHTTVVEVGRGQKEKTCLPSTYISTE